MKVQSIDNLCFASEVTETKNIKISDSFFIKILPILIKKKKNIIKWNFLVLEITFWKINNSIKFYMMSHFIFVKKFNKNIFDLKTKYFFYISINTKVKELIFKPTEGGGHFHIHLLNLKWHEIRLLIQMHSCIEAHQSWGIY